MNRFDGIIEFQPLSKENLLEIVSLMLDDVNKRLSHNGISLHVTDKVKEKLVDLGYDPKMGARPLRRTIQDQIEDAITDFYLEHPAEKTYVLSCQVKVQFKSRHKQRQNKKIELLLRVAYFTVLILYFLNFSHLHPIKTLLCKAYHKEK